MHVGFVKRWLDTSSMALSHHPPPAGACLRMPRSQDSFKVAHQSVLCFPYPPCESWRRFFLVPASSQVRRSCCPSAAGRTQQRGMKEFLKNMTVSLGIWKAQTPGPESPLENTEGERVTRAVSESQKRTKSAIGQAALSSDTAEDSWAWTVMREPHPAGANEPQHELPGGAGAARSWSLPTRGCITHNSVASVVSSEQGLGRTHNREKKPHMGTSQAEGTHIWLQQLRPIK